MLMRLMSKSEYLIIPKGMKFMGLGKLGLKNITGYSKRAGEHPGTVDCTSKIHSSALGVEEKAQLVCTQCDILRLQWRSH